MSYPPMPITPGKFTVLPADWRACQFQPNVFFEMVGCTNADPFQGCAPGTLVCTGVGWDRGNLTTIDVRHFPDRDLREPLHIVEMSLDRYAAANSRPIPGSEHKAVRFPEPSAEIVYHGLPELPDEPIVREARHGE